MEGRFGRIAPLVDQLQQFCLGHEEGDAGTAATDMIGYLRDAWPEIPAASLAVERDGRDAEELALGIIRDVGEVAAVLLGGRDPDQDLAWSRANLIFDLERYAILVARPT